MQLNPSKIILSLVLLFSSITALAQTTIYGLTSDAQLTAASVDVLSTLPHAGFSGTTGRNATFVFDLPELDEGYMITSATLYIYYKGKDGTPPFNADLYALEDRSTADCTIADFYIGSNDSNAVMIEDDFYTPSIASNGYRKSTSEAADLLLADYLNNEIESNPNGYAIFRLSPDANVNCYNRYRSASADYADSYFHPKLVYEVGLKPVEVVTYKIKGLAYDAQITQGTPNTVDTTETKMQVGFSGTSGRNAALVFQMPELPIGKKIANATLRFYYAGKISSPVYNADLYALGGLSVPDVFPEDLYVGAYDENAILIQDDILTPAFTTSKSVYTSEEASPAITDYLNAQYSIGNGAGNYVFFRLNPDAAYNCYNRYRISSADDSNSYVHPYIEYELADAPITNGEYNWSNVAINGGGYVTGLVVHPTEQDLIYARTDVGGAYRWDAINEEWIPITDSLMNMTGYSGDNWLFHCAGMAIDPNDPDVVYYTAGEYSNGTDDVFVSYNRGGSWSRTSLRKKMYGNRYLRFVGERLMVDPNNSNIVYCATPDDGLWRMVNGNWYNIPLPSIGTLHYGVTFVAVDGNSDTVTITGDNYSETASKSIYVGVYNNDNGDVGAVYISHDAGATWTAATGADLDQPTRADVASDGTVYIAAKNTVAKLAYGSTVVTDLTPLASILYVGIVVDPNDPDTVMVSERDASYSNKIWRSTDGGNNWNLLSKTHHNSGVTRSTSNWFGAVSDIMISPWDSDEVWISDWLGVVRTQNMSASTSDWYNLQKGHEETVPLVLKSPSAGAPLLSGLADVNGFQHFDFSVIPDKKFNNPSWGWTSGLDFCESDPDIVVRSFGYFSTRGDVSYSTDGGDTWNQMTNPGGSDSYGKGYYQGGRIAASATDTSNFVWLPEGSNGVHVTSDRGTSWTQATGLPSTGIISDEFQQSRTPLAADRVNGDVFYLFKGYNGYATIYRSDDGGYTWSAKADIDYPDGKTYLYNYCIKTNPNVEGDVWVAISGCGLFRSTDSAETFTQLTDVSASMISFGKGISTTPTVVIIGTATIDGESTAGVLLSDDMGATWRRVDREDQTIGTTKTCMEADKQVYGRVYIGTAGRGIYVGQMTTQ